MKSCFIGSVQPCCILQMIEVVVRLARVCMGISIIFDAICLVLDSLFL